jgi:hypothetical protein
MRMKLLRRHASPPSELPIARLIARIGVIRAMSKGAAMASARPVFWHAIRHFWLTREGQADAQVLRGARDQGTRGAVTGGGHLDGFLVALSESLTAAGVPAASIFTGRSDTVLPGYFRPAKKWDLLVVHRGELFGAVELKSQVGSLGNNANNRFEESIGNAVDFERAHRLGTVRAVHKPWVGYLFVLAPTTKAMRPVRTSAPHFPVLPEHLNASYATRLGTICARLEQEGLYDATCPILTESDHRDAVPNYLEPQPRHSGERFVKEMVAGVTDRMRARRVI